MLLVYGRIRIVPPRRQDQGVRRGPALLLRRAAVLPDRPIRDTSLQPRQDLLAEIPHHRIPAHLLRGGELRRCQGKNEVRYFCLVLFVA